MSAQPPTSHLDFALFVAAVVRELDIDPPLQPTPTTDLYDDLGLDSLQAMELLLLVEEWAGRRNATEALPVLFTLGDAYTWYVGASA
jgi:acyl carrier protein